MQTVWDFRRKIIEELSKEKSLSFKDLYEKMAIEKYQERSNFLEALNDLQVRGRIYNPNRTIYELFPKETHHLDKVVRTKDGLFLKAYNEKITNDVTKGRVLLENDVVVVTYPHNEDGTLSPLVKKIVGRNIESFKPYLLSLLENEELTHKQIKRLAIARDAKSVNALIEMLDQLEKSGKIYLDGNKYKKWPNNLVLTKLEMDTNNRVYYLVNEKKVYKEGEDLKGAIPGDVIAVSKNGKKLVKIITRNNKRMVAEIIEDDGVKVLEPVLVPGKGKIKTRISSNVMKKLAVGDRILIDVSLDKYDEYYEANYVDKLGRIDDPNIDIISIATKYGFAINFPTEVMEEALSLPQVVSSDELSNRTDFRSRLTTFTIDCDNTKDMDDAVSIMINDKGNYLLFVHIADVSHYIKNNSLLDKEARERSTSCYPANTVIPMLPHLISNGICSLNPHVDRLTKTVVMEFNKEGDLLDYNLTDSIINSDMKMKYSLVNQLLVGNNIDEDYLPFKDDLEKMAKLSSILSKKREAEGMLNFDTDEVGIVEDKKGNVVNLLQKDNGEAGKIIENFMIMANYCTNMYLNFIVGSSINRTHQAPDIKKLTDATLKLKSEGFDLPDVSEMEPSLYIQTVLNKYKTDQNYNLISETLLKAMPRAFYSPTYSGHFGLSLDYYTHSTSPIRRYPDLKVQQIIDSFQHGKYKDIESEEVLEEICLHASFKERQADFLEREVLLVKMMDYVDRHPDKRYYGTITAIDKQRAYLETVTRIPGYIDYSLFPDLHYVSSKKYIKNRDDQVILKVGDLVQVQSNMANRRELKVDFTCLTNLTLRQHNMKGATALRNTYVKKLTNNY